MRRLGVLLPLLVSLLLTSAHRVHGQSISLSPSKPNVPLGNTVQFHAEVHGLPNTAVIWSAGGMKGGNSTSGTISSTGLYQAPSSMPGQNPVSITVTSQANTQISSSTYVNLLYPGPTITSVSPNPLSVGTITVTIQGSGFKSGATVFDSYGNYSNIQLSTTSLTEHSITATGYQGSASSASFCVKNPGSTYSNSITVPVSGNSSNYSLEVVNGSGGGSYSAGSVVTITANAPPMGQKFLNWTGATVQNPNSPTTTLTMPASNTIVKANYTNNNTSGKYTLNVVSGSGGGSYAAGTVVTITANAPPMGQTFLKWTGATVSNPSSPTTTLTMPSDNITVTATYTNNSNSNYTLNVVSGSGGGSYTTGTVVTITANTAPPGQTFLDWTGAKVQNANAPTTTLTMPAENISVTANYTSIPVQIPYPVSTHPRLWITQSDLSRLQSWANANNSIYEQGMVPLLSQAVSVYNTQFFPNGVPNQNYPDPGDTQGYTGYLTENYGVVLAFNSLIAPESAARIRYAQYARNLLMYAMNQAALGHLSGAPFRDPYFAIYNRANGSGEQWPLIVDWIYSAKDSQGNPILTATDKTTIRNVFMMWANDCLNAYTTGGDHPAPIGVMNSLQLLPNNLPYRMAANNYYLGHARLLTMMSLSIDPSDDPAVNPNAPLSQLGNSLRSYILDANGAWLYQEFAMFGEPTTAANAYGISGNGAGWGLASGGLPPEGMLYGHSYSFILGQLLALQTAGFNNVSYSGPQIQMIGAPMWDRFVPGFLSSLTPTAKTFSSQPWLGPVYQFGSYGDLLRLWVTPDFMQPFSLLALLDEENGKTTHLDAARWFVVNAVEGGSATLMNRITMPWSSSPTASILYYMLLDPSASSASDPRSSLPTTFYDASAGRIVAHSDWSADGTMFDYRASWLSINHQDGDGGQFELYRKGEWLTKEMSNYDNNAVGLTTTYHNSLALQNWCANGTPNLQWFEKGEWALGSEWMLGLNAGDPTTMMSSGPDYVYATSDLTNLFNRPDIWSQNDSATNIKQATRSIVWLHNDYVVVYDRATSLNAGLFKRFNLSLVTNPVIKGNVAVETIESGQQLFVQTLLPKNPSISAVYAAGNLNPIAQLEPTQYIMTVQDPTLPTNTRFLHVLQGADPGVSMASAIYLQSSSGAGFDGTVFGSMAVYFPVNTGGTFSATTFNVPTGVHTLLVTGLATGTSYVVNVQNGNNGVAISVSQGSNGTKSDGAGVLKISF